jgi:glycolate dehydrogenase FAD-binding subunit
MDGRGSHELSPPPAGLRAGADGDAVDAVVPSRVAAPASAEDVAAVVAAANESGDALVVAGGATLLSAGNPPRRLDTLVVTSGLRRIVEQRPEDMTVTVEGGVTLAQLSAVLAESGQRLAVDSPADDRATVGGVVATNSTGGLAYGFGAPRDLVLGMVVVDGRGRRLRLGGRVVKNVAGYDLVRLFTGSFGTLGVITEITLRTHPLPAAATTLDLAFSTDAALDAARAAVFRSGLPLASFDVVFAPEPGTEGRRLVIRVEGTECEVEAQVARLAAACGARTLDSRDDWRSPLHPLDEESLVVRVGVEPAAVVRVARRLEATAGRGARVAGRCGDGTLRVFARSGDAGEAAELAAALRREAERDGGVAVFERLPAAAKTRLDAWGAPPATVSLMRAIKDRFDPNRVLAPGRFVGGI